MSVTLGAFNTLCRLKISNFWPPPTLLVLFSKYDLQFFTFPLSPWNDIVYERPLNILFAFDTFQTMIRKKKHFSPLSNLVSIQYGDTFVWGSVNELENCSMQHISKGEGSSKPKCNDITLYNYNATGVLTFLNFRIHDSGNFLWFPHKSMICNEKIIWKLAKNTI